MPLSEHDEIECKFDATNVGVRTFKAWCIDNLDVESYLRIVDHPDDYYQRDTTVVRHRIDPGEGHELTVKKRKSAMSIRDRREIDLHFDPKTKPFDVAAFLDTIGFKCVMTVLKDAHIFWVQLTPNLKASFVVYDVYRADKPDDVKRFIEIEAKKGSDVTPETAKRHIRQWATTLQEHFELSDPLNLSLWEIFSGQIYDTV